MGDCPVVGDALSGYLRSLFVLPTVLDEAEAESAARSPHKGSPDREDEGCKIMTPYFIMAALYLFMALLMALDVALVD